MMFASDSDHDSIQPTGKNMKEKHASTSLDGQCHDTNFPDVEIAQTLPNTQNNA